MEHLLLNEDFWAGWGMWIGVLIKIFYFWLLWVFIAACNLSLVAASRGYFSLRYVGFSLRWLLLLGSTGSRYVGSVVVTHELSCSVACGIFLNQVSNPCPLHWQVDFQPLDHQGSLQQTLLIHSLESKHNISSHPCCSHYFWHLVWTLILLITVALLACDWLYFTWGKGSFSWFWSFDARS